MPDRLDPALLDSLWDFSGPGASATLLHEAQEGLGPVATAELQTQYARALGLKEHFDEADAVLDAVDSSDPVVQVRLALERGRILNSSGHPDDAIPYFSEGAQLSAQIGEDFLEVDALHMLAIADAANTESWARNGITRAEQSTDTRTHRWAIGLHNNLGWHYFDAEKFAEALAEFEASASAAREFGTPQQQQWAAEAMAEAAQKLKDAGN